MPHQHSKRKYERRKQSYFRHKTFRSTIKDYVRQHSWYDMEAHETINTLFDRERLLNEIKLPAGYSVSMVPALDVGEVLYGPGHCTPCWFNPRTEALI